MQNRRNPNFSHGPIVVPHACRMCSQRYLVGFDKVRITAFNDPRVVDPAERSHIDQRQIGRPGDSNLPRFPSNRIQIQIIRAGAENELRSERRFSRAGVAYDCNAHICFLTVCYANYSERDSQARSKG